MALQNKSLSFITWNVTGVMSCASYSCDILTGQIDICGISEHWLSPHNVFFLSHVSGMYNYHAVCDSDLQGPSNRKVGKGGVAILWHRKCNDYVVPLCIDSDRIAGIQLELSPGHYFFIFQVYLPCTNHGIDSYRHCINMLFDLYYCYRDSGINYLYG